MLDLGFSEFSQNFSHNFFSQFPRGDQRKTTQKAKKAKKVQANELISLFVYFPFQARLRTLATVLHQLMQASQTTMQKKGLLYETNFFTVQIYLQTFSIRDIFAPKLDTNLYDDETVKYINLFPLGKATFYHRDSISRNKAQVEQG